MATVFDSIVTKENDHTNLLRSIMERHPKAAAAVLSHLIGGSISEVEAASLQYTTQQSFAGPNGREIPDIFIQGRDFHCLIEAKIDPTLELTAGQKSGYRGCFPDHGDCHLSFLVPSEWKHVTKIDLIRDLLPNSIAVHTSSWRGLIKELEKTSRSINDAVLHEIISFWRWRFQLEHMTPQERNSLDIWTEEKYSAIRKLEKTLTQAKGLFDAHGFETQLETLDTYSYGFYVKQGRMYLLWVGIWTKAPAPLSYGFHSSRMDWLRPKVLPLTSHTAHDHHLWPLDAETWDEPEKLYEVVSSFLRSHPVS